jgi:hypothetical protein
MSALHPSSIRPFLISRPRHHVFPNTSSSKCKTALLPNDGVLPTTGIFTECFEENLLPNGVFLPNSAHKSVSFLYQFLVLTLISINSLPEEEQTSKHGGGGRYNEILEFKGEQIENLMRKKKKK